MGTLEALIEAGHEVALVVTQPDKPKGRGGKIHCLKPGCGYEEGLAAPEKEEAAAVETDDMPPVEKKTPAKKTASKKAPAKKAPAKKPAAKKTAGKSAGGESRES